MTWAVPTQRQGPGQDHSAYVPGHVPFRMVRSAIYAQRMEVVARPATVGTLAYWLRSLFTAMTAGSDEAVDAAYAPAVVAVSSAGEERRLQRTGTYRQAQAACRRLEADRRRLGDAAFCQQYGLPGRFAD